MSVSEPARRCATLRDRADADVQLANMDMDVDATVTVTAGPGRARHRANAATCAQIMEIVSSVRSPSASVTSRARARVSEADRDWEPLGAGQPTGPPREPKRERGIEMEGREGGRGPSKRGGPHHGSQISRLGAIK